MSSVNKSEPEHVSVRMWNTGLGRLLVKSSRLYTLINSKPQPFLLTRALGQPHIQAILSDMKPKEAAKLLRVLNFEPFQTQKRRPTLNA